MTAITQSLRRNRTLWITLVIILLLFLLAIQGMSTRDWVITLLRGLSVGALTFLVAAGFSLIFGLLDVLNLAHGTLFMIGAYIGWTVFVRTDTFVDLLAPFALVLAGFMLLPAWDMLFRRQAFQSTVARLLPWVGLLAGVGLVFYFVSRYPVTGWNLEDFNTSPGSVSYLAEQGQLKLPPATPFRGISPAADIGGILLSAALLAAGLAALGRMRARAGHEALQPRAKLPWKPLVLCLLLAAAGILLSSVRDPLIAFLTGLPTIWLFLVAMLVATLAGVLMGALMESTLIRPLYSRPIYQLMLTLGLSAIGIEMVRAIWGQPEFTMPNPSLFNGSGQGCPATSLGAFLANQCSTVALLGGRVRTYNEIFIPLVGLVVLVGVWLLLKYTRIGMVIRAGVQDREMVEALGINVRRVFTLVFALGVGLAALGGVLAGPSMGLSSAMGDNLLLNALIALAIGGLTSYPGAAAGSVLVGLLQQFMIKYGQIGIHLPFLAAPFKPTPPLVPASTVLLMVIILLVLPQGLFGRKE